MRASQRHYVKGLLQLFWSSRRIASVIVFEEHCGLCHSPLGNSINHPSQQSNDAYLITELNLFKKVDVKVKTCTKEDCLAIHQTFQVDNRMVSIHLTETILVWIYICPTLSSFVLFLLKYDYGKRENLTQCPKIFCRVSPSVKGNLNLALPLGWLLSDALIAIRQFPFESHETKIKSSIIILDQTYQSFFFSLSLISSLVIMSKFT